VERQRCRLVSSCWALSVSTHLRLNLRIRFQQRIQVLHPPQTGDDGGYVYWLGLERVFKKDTVTYIMFAFCVGFCCCGF
jgi:hypothetical protein